MLEVAGIYPVSDETVELLKTAGITEGQLQLKDIEDDDLEDEQEAA